MTLLPFGVDSFTGIHPFLLVIAAAALDRLVGDPRWCLHPVVVMGWWISRLRRLAEQWAGDRPWALRLGGCLITALLVGGSGASGWLLERWALGWVLPEAKPVALLLLLIALASALARAINSSSRATGFASGSTQPRAHRSSSQPLAPLPPTNSAVIKQPPRRSAQGRSPAHCSASRRSRLIHQPITTTGCRHQRGSPTRRSRAAAAITSRKGWIPVKESTPKGSSVMAAGEA